MTLPQLSPGSDDRDNGMTRPFTASAETLDTVGYGLAALSIGLGLAELLAGKSVARRLGVPRHSRIVRAFGVRELVSGAALIARPRASRNAWGRIAGDALDLAALAAALSAPSARKRVIWGGIAFVGTALIADAIAGAAMRREERHGAG
ncbi:hypothetical protein J3454_15900 [Erythrobacter sp. NFXS35]|uniref:hypothetical protein n=1 Tax=Erythrobacter sp. NFXS35 TaxID=2818436 RepID=UPI0032E03050